MQSARQGSSQPAIDKPANSLVNSSLSAFDRCASMATVGTTVAMAMLAKTPGNQVAQVNPST